MVAKVSVFIIFLVSLHAHGDSSNCVVRQSALAPLIMIINNDRKSLNEAQCVGKIESSSCIDLRGERRHQFWVHHFHFDPTSTSGRSRSITSSSSR